ncbi:DUF6194 family protein [Muribaculum intestinale]|uniref:DUF6194 family protein n=1 Tax=Muribaculum intestinale TaxID=1796646 RepID=UPI00339D7679
MSEVKITVESGYIPRVYPIPYKGGLVDMSYDFIAKDVIMLHPVYAWMDWICFLSPYETTFESLKTYIREYYKYAKETFGKRRLRCMLISNCS